MDKNFAFLNFCTEYSSQGDTNKVMSKEYCFNSIFHSEKNGVRQNNTYKIKVYKTENLGNKSNNNNTCLIDKKGIIHHLKILKSIFKFKHHIKEFKDYYIITLTLDNDLIYHKYLLSWVRYLYEYPFSVFLADALKLKQLPKFRFESVINLFNIVGATSGINVHGVDIHAIGNTHMFKELLTTKQIQEGLSQLQGGHQNINDIFPYVDSEFDDKLETIEADSDEICSSDYWCSEKGFNTRLSSYQENYKVIKNIKKK